MNTNWKIIAGIVGGGIVAAGIVIWLAYFNTPDFAPAQEQPPFGQSNIRATTGVTVLPDANGPGSAANGVLSSKKVFKIADGPVAGATFVQIFRPATSTIARFVMATNGHAFDLVLDSPGAVPKAISNTTIPGIARVQWSEKGRGVLMQYIDVGAVKTVHFALPAADATTTSPVRIRFLPAGITSFAISPDGANAAYLLKTASGANGYTARADGADAKNIFSMPLSELLLSWPTEGTLFAQTASAAGIPGVVFSIDAKTGAYAPLLYAQGLTSTANRSLSHIIYQTISDTRSTYSQNLKTGLSTPLSFDPIPEMCKWSNATSTTLYCATPLAYVALNYLDLRHLGAASAPNSLLSFDLSKGRSNIVASPGGADGGEQSDIVELGVSPDDRYLLFIRSGDRSLWGVRL